MSDLAKEVAEELKKNAPGLTWFQRASLIVFANVVGLVLGAIVIAAGGIVWNKAMSTDDISEARAEGDAALREEMLEQKADLMAQIQSTEQRATAERETILEAVATMGAEHKKFMELVSRWHPEDHGEGAAIDPESHAHEAEGEHIAGVDIPEPAPPQAALRAIPVPEDIEPSAAAVKEQREVIQQQIDKRIYREKARE